jgi:hypothetical protein
MRIFISYRRDDSAGHAGRLADDLAERFGHHDVFEDVDSIEPGEDFVDVIERAVASADVVLAVIGPEWAMATDEHGVLRLHRADDVLRRELVAALRSGTRLIPGARGRRAHARDTRAAERPGAARPPQRHRAPGVGVGGRLRSARPLARAADSTRRPIPAAASDAPVGRAGRHRRGGGGRRRGRRVPGGWRRGRGSLSTILSTKAQGAPASTTAASSTGGPTGSTAGGGDVPLPAVARTILHPAGLELVAEVRAFALEPGAAGVTARLRMRFEVHDKYDAGLGGSDVQLVVDGVPTNPADPLGLLVPGRSVAEADLRFELANTPAEVAVAIHTGGVDGSIPLLGPGTAPSETPELVADPRTVEVSTVTYTVGPPGLELYSDRTVVSVPIRASNNGLYPDGFSDGDFRLHVNGESKAPVGQQLNQVLDPATTQDATVRWDIPLGPHALVLSIEHGGQQERVELTPS